MDLSNMTVTDLVFTSKLYTDAGSERSRRSRERWGFIYKFEGETVYSFDGGGFVSNSSCIAVLPKGADYTWKCTESGGFFAIEFECSGCSETEPFAVRVKDPERILQIISELLGKYASGRSRPELLSCFYSLIARITQKNSYVPKSKEERLIPALAFMKERYSCEITNRELAKLCGISEVYFRKLFFAVFGTSPIHFLHLIRIERAKEMLGSDFGKISEVGEAVGYSSIYHFSKMFKLYAGVSPSEYVKSI